jgi:hypothetical protein
MTGNQWLVEHWFPVVFTALGDSTTQHRATVDVQNFARNVPR